MPLWSENKMAELDTVLHSDLAVPDKSSQSITLTSPRSSHSQTLLTVLAGGRKTNGVRVMLYSSFSVPILRTCI